MGYSHHNPKSGFVQDSTNQATEPHQWNPALNTHDSPELPVKVLSKAPAKQQQEVKDNGSTGKYFHIMLNMADDDLNPYQYRLLGHYRRVCGEHGACWESVRTTAKTCKMSAGKVSGTRNELTRLGYIEVEHREDDTCRITLIDRMAENIERYAKCSPHEQVTKERSPGEQGVHVVKQRITTRRRTIKDSGATGVTPDAPKSYAEQHPEKSEAELEAGRQKAIADSIAQGERHLARNQDFEDLCQAVSDIIGFGGATGKQYAHMLRGTARKGKYAENKIEGGITAANFRRWHTYYLRYQVKDAERLSGIKDPEKLNGYIEAWIGLGMPDAPPVNGHKRNDPLAHIARTSKAEQEAEVNAAALRKLEERQKEIEVRNGRSA